MAHLRNNSLPPLWITKAKAKVGMKTKRVELSIKISGIFSLNKS